MNPMQANLVRFQREAGNGYANAVPTIPPDDQVALRVELITEEFRELIDAMGESDITHIAKEMCDLLYVVFGSAVAYGIDLDPLFELVHESNMAKAKGPLRPDGKRLKPEGWRPPALGEEIRRQWELGTIAEAGRCEWTRDGCRCTMPKDHGGKLHAPALFTEAQERGEK